MVVIRAANVAGMLEVLSTSTEMERSSGSALACSRNSWPLSTGMLRSRTSVPGWARPDTARCGAKVQRLLAVEDVMHLDFSGQVTQQLGKKLGVCRFVFNEQQGK